MLLYLEWVFHKAPMAPEDKCTFSLFSAEVLGWIAWARLFQLTEEQGLCIAPIKTNYGAIAMRQRASDNSPATNFFVGRYSENIGANNRLSGLVTVKNEPGNTNIVSTIDGFFRLGETNSLNTLLMHSDNTQKGKSGAAGIAQFFHSTNHMKIWFTQSYVSKDFDPEMGFVSRTDVIGTTPGMNWYYRGKRLLFKKILRAFEPGFLPELYWQASTGKSIERTFTLFPVWLNFQSGAYFGYAIAPAYQRLTEPFEPL